MTHSWLYTIEGADGTTADYEVRGRYEAEARLKAQALWKAERPHEPIIWLEVSSTTKPSQA